MLENAADIDEVVTIFAGKFRRYHNEAWWQRILDIKTHLLNARDVFYIALGFFQSLKVVRRYRPSAVFLKGGFVGVPVGLAAGIKKKPIMTHDSDAVAGLANRLVSRYVSIHATALEADNYPYISNKVQQVGVIVSHKYQPVGEPDKKDAKNKLDIPKDAKLVLVTGGSTGSTAINTGVEKLYDRLFNSHSNLYIIHQTGKGKAGNPEQFKKYSRLQRLELLENMYMYSAAADIIVSRAGANTLAEFAVQGKACVVVPSPHLPAGHQLRNADYYEKRGAIATVAQEELEASPGILYDAIDGLLADDTQRSELAERLHQELHHGAGEMIAKKLYDLAETYDANDKARETDVS